MMTTNAGDSLSEVKWTMSYVSINMQIEKLFWIVSFVLFSTLQSAASSSVPVRETKDEICSIERAPTFFQNTWWVENKNTTYDS